ncbi:MAG: hypothetical protein KDC07_02440 [Chitinophagaceae bacterium]|nr:hypothetical protein [Chitinophagaceae bacterium]
MKKIYTLSAAVLCSLQVMSQPWLENVNVEQMTVAEIAEAYEARPSLNHSVDEEKGTTDNEDEREDNNYHFRRWLNFVEGRTDQQGHLVSTAHIWR